MAKGIGGGFPLGAMMLGEHLSKSLPVGSHGTTYGGNLLACRAAIVVLEQLANGTLLDHIRQAGAQTIPQVLRMMKAIFSGVQCTAAQIRSPSFSRSSSSVTMTSASAPSTQA